MAMNPVPLSAMPKRLLTLAVAVALIFALRTWNQHTSKESPPQLPGAEAPQWSRTSWDGLYTRINLTAYGTPAQLDTAMSQIDALFTKFTAKFVANGPIDSLVFNARRGDTLRLEHEAWEMFDFGRRAYLRSNGRIHPGIGNLLRAYGLVWGVPRSEANPAEIARLRKRLDTLFFEMVPGQDAVVILQDSIHPAFGSFGEGWALDAAGHIMEKAGLEHYLMEVGGDIRAHGRPANHDRLTAAVALDTLTGIALSTSGNYEKFTVDSAGKKHHHILDPRTGESSTGKRSVSVIARSAIEADVMSTWFFILEPDSIRQVIAQDTTTGVVIISEGSETWVSPNLRNRLEWLPQEPAAE